MSGSQYLGFCNMMYVPSVILCPVGSSEKNGCNRIAGTLCRWAPPAAVPPQRFTRNISKVTSYSAVQRTGVTVWSVQWGFELNVLVGQRLRIAKSLNFWTDLTNSLIRRPTEVQFTVEFTFWKATASDVGLFWLPSIMTVLHFLELRF